MMQHSNGKNFPVLALILLISFSTATSAFSQASTLESQAASIGKKASILSDYLQDLDSFEKSFAERRMTAEFLNVNLAFSACLQQATIAYSVALLLRVYSRISTSRDRDSVRPWIKETLKAHSSGLERSIEHVNYAVAQAQNQGVALTATRLRDNLREIKNLYDSITLP